MAEPNMITEAFATGEEIGNIIMAIEPILFNRPRAHVMIACLSLVFTMMDPEITEEKLKEGMKGVSQWICLFLTNNQPSDTPEGAKELLN